MALPTHPAAYWHPDVNLSDVWWLRLDGSWSFYGRTVDPSDVPTDLQLLGEYKKEAY